MKITCDKCGASYKIPEEKLTRDVSKATCKKCGEKIIIRKPGATDAYEDPRLTGGLHASGDDDGMVDHNEERTVIAQVPELQKYDATPPLAVASTTTVPSLPDPRRESAGTSTGSMGAPRPIEPISRPMSPPLAAPRAEPAFQGVSAAPAPAPAAAQSALPAQSVAQAAPAGTTTTRKPAARKAATWLAVGPLILAVVGLLLYIPQGLWGMANYQAVGFMLALFGSLAAIVLQAELIRTGSLNMALGFLLPALGVVGLGGTLLSIQEVPFLTEGVKESLDLIIATAAQPEAPDAKPMSLAERVRQKKANKPKPRLTLPSGDIPVALNGGVDPASAAQAGLKDPGAPGEVQPGGEVGTTGGTLPLPNMRRGPQSDIGKAVAQATVDWDHEKIDAQLEGSRVRKLCYGTALKGMSPPKRLEFRMLVTPEGKVTQAQVTGPEEFKQSSLADCMIEKVKSSSWPTHNSAKPEWYTKSFL